MPPCYRSWTFWQCVVLVATLAVGAWAGTSLFGEFVGCMLAFGAGAERARTEGRAR